MTEAELDEWIDYLGALQPTWRAWALEQTHETRAQWMRRCSHATLEQMKRASDAYVEGEPAFRIDDIAFRCFNLVRPSWGSPAVHGAEPAPAQRAKAKTMIQEWLERNRHLSAAAPKTE